MFIRNVYILIICCFALWANAAEKFTVNAVPVEENTIRLDGILDETVWKNARKYSNFTILQHPERSADESTSFQVAASRNGLYFAFDVVDKNMVATVKDFDGPIHNEDAIELFITADDPIPDDPNVHNCRQLLFSPAGIRADLSYLGGISERKWTSDWKVAVVKNEHGFTAELFLPYYALNIVNSNCRRFHFNIARENLNGPRQILSVWKPTSRFIDQNNFGTLELPYNDFSTFNWNLSNLELKNIPTLSGAKQMLTGIISGNDNCTITIQATARRDQKLIAFNRQQIHVKGNTAFQIPLKVGISGQYEITLTGRIGNNKVLHSLHGLHMEAMPFKFKLQNPVYRKSIFPDQKDKIIRFSIDYQSQDPKLLASAKTAFTIADVSGKAVASGEKNSGSIRTFTVDASRWQPGKYTITIKSSGKDALNGSFQDTFYIVASATKGNSVRLGNGRMMILNGKPFFPRGFLDGDNRKAELFAEMSAAGYNVVHFYSLNQMKPERIKFILDEAQKHNLKVLCYPYFRCKISCFGFIPVSAKRGSPRLTQAAWNDMKSWVNQVKEHPAFLGWYLCDEPKGVEFGAELRKVYSCLKEIDPHHPVISLDMNAEGCLNKREGFADIHILDMYPHPLTNGGWQRTISSVLSSMKQVSDGVAPHGSWFCPEAFKPISKVYRSLTYREIRCLVFGSIVNGANAIIPYKIGNPKAKYFHNTNSGIFETPDLHFGYFKGIGPELTGLEAVLLEPERLLIKSSAANVIVMRKRHNGKEFIIAVNTMPDEQNCTVSSPDLPNGQYRVLGENRIVEVRDGKLNDRFIGYMTHIYTNDLNIKAPVDIAALEKEIQATSAAALKSIRQKP